PTGLFESAKTIGILGVAFIAAIAPNPAVTMTLTFSRARSAANSAKRSPRPSAQRYSIATVRPSIQPSSVNLFIKAVVHGFQPIGVLVPRKPTVGKGLVC